MAKNKVFPGPRSYKRVEKKRVKLAEGGLSPGTTNQPLGRIQANEELWISKHSKWFFAFKYAVCRIAFQGTLASNTSAAPGFGECFQ